MRLEGRQGPSTARPDVRICERERKLRCFGRDERGGRTKEAGDKKRGRTRLAAFAPSN
jgi:hypothetical protein